MKDVFYTLLVVWVIWRVMNAFSSDKSKPNNTPPPSSRPYTKKEGETTVDYVPPKSKGIKDDAGEYVDYEEIK